MPLDRMAVAAALRETAALLAVTGADKFKRRAYENGARALEALEGDFDALVRDERLTEIPGIGEKLARQIEELCATGRSEQLERLRGGVPPGTLEAIGASRERVSSLRLAEALALEARLLAFLKDSTAIREVSAAGDLRRRLEVMPRVDLVASSESAGAALARMLKYPAISAVVERDARSVTVRLAEGALVRLVVASPGAFASTLLHETGSPAHLARLAELAAAGGVTLGPDGWKAGGKRLRAADESALYGALGLPFIPPELRDGEAEIEAARDGSLPELVVEGDVRGYVHCHTHHSDGSESVLAMARAAEARGREYITITDHSPTAHYARGLPPERLARQWREIEHARKKVGIGILKGTESDILPDGSLDYPDEILAQLDIVIASLHTRNRMDRTAMTRRLAGGMRHPFFKVWGHPLGRLLLRRPAADCDVDAVLDALVASRGAVEVNGDPYRLDMEPRLIRRARARGLKFVLSTDAHSISDLGFLTYAVAIARRGWLSKDDVLNALGAEAFAAAVKPRRGRAPKSPRKSAA